MTVMMCAALKTDQDFGPLLNSLEAFHLEVRPTGIRALEAEVPGKPGNIDIASCDKIGNLHYIRIVLSV